MAETEPEQEPPKGGSSILLKIGIAGFIGAVIMTEVAVAYMFIPSASDVEALAVEKAAAELKAEAEASGEVDETRVEMAEVDLGSFALAMSRPGSTSTVRINFHLWGAVTEEEQAEFATMLEKYRHRMRDIVVTEVRGSESTEIDEASLGLIKRRILEKSNQLLGKPLLKSVMFSNFSFVDQ